MYVWQWSVLAEYSQVFLKGTLLTLCLTVVAIAVGTILGIVLVLLRRSENPLTSLTVRIYIELFRGLPILVLLIWIFYVVPLLLDIRLSPFVAGVVALALNLSAYIAETVRGGISSIQRNQYESGLTLGIPALQVMFLIVLPQALRATLPSILGLYIETLKNSSLTSVIAVNELLHRSNGLISATYRPLEIYTAVAGIYLVIIIPTTLLSTRLEQKLQKQQRNI